MWRNGLVAALFAALLIPGMARAAELVMFVTEGCPYCAAWDRDVGRIYKLTDEARTLPLRKVDLDRPLPADLGALSGVALTPTFVVLDRGREIGRIVGFLGDEQFWDLLGEIMRNLKKAGG